MQKRPPARLWTPNELATLQALYPDRSSAAVAAVLGREVSSVYQKAAALGLKKSAAFFAGEEAGRIRRSQQQSLVVNRFKPGQTPWNKGTKGVMPKPAPGKGFQPGDMPHTRKPIGAERRDKDGHLVRKVSETRIKKVDWQLVKNIVWREHFGEIPPGLFVVCQDRNPDNLDPGNMALVTRAENMRRNSYRTNYPPELARLVQLRGVLNRQINKLSRNQAQQDAP